jgi:diguanylate cyclase (GGDEF)-like protein
MKWLRIISLIALGISGVVITASYTGLFQTLELSIFDWWFRLRPAEAREERIVVVTISESDINHLGQWPISDEILSQVITKIKQQQPRTIGLDIYRDLPVQPGTKKLASILNSTPNLVGVEKAIDEKVNPSPILKAQEQVALADLIVDRDSQVRRGLLSIQLDNGEVQLGLATRLALMYLAAEGVELQPVGDTSKRSLGKAVFTPFNQNDGGYIRADAGGFQILLNFRGTESSFHHVSIVDILKGNIPEDLMRDRIVLIGSTAPSLNDLFTSPYAGERDKSQYLAGVFIHANLTSQILSAALDGRKLIKVVSEPLEWLWILLWTSTGSGINLLMLHRSNFSKENSSLVKSTCICIVLPGIILWGSSYLLFLSGWWLPVATPLLALIGSTVVVSNYHQQNQKKLAFIDGLTQIPNRRFFDQFLEQHWLESTRKHQSLCLILCDVDHFKKYNDTYGHQAGDLCLQKVAKIISEAIGSNDLAARYGGEEFAVIIPNASPEVAIMIAKNIGDRLRALQLPHSSSQASKYVTLSCGIASTSKNLVTSPEDLIKQADLALYQAKEQGRDRAVLA